jgi:hypothetical protein
VLGGRGDVDALLGEAKLEQRVHPVLLVGRLGERAAEVARRGFGRSPDDRPVAGGPQRVDDEGIAGRRDEIDVRGDALGLLAGLVEQLGGPAVHRQPLRGLDRLVDGGAHDRVDELDVLGRDAQEVGAGERGRRERREVPVVQVGERRRMPNFGSVAEHGDGNREAPGLRGKTREPQRHRARHRLRPDLAHPAGVLGRGREALAVDRIQNRA